MSKRLVIDRLGARMGAPLGVRVLLSKREAAEALSVSVRTLEKLIKTNELTSRKLGRRRLVPYTALLNFAHRQHHNVVRQGE